MVPRSQKTQQLSAWEDLGAGFLPPHLRTCSSLCCLDLSAPILPHFLGPTLPGNCSDCLERPALKLPILKLPFPVRSTELWCCFSLPAPSCPLQLNYNSSRERAVSSTPCTPGSSFTPKQEQVSARPGQGRGNQAVTTSSLSPPPSSFSAHRINSKACFRQKH